MLRKVLVANRGEIAVRVIRGLRELGIRSVAVFSDADRASLPVRLADEAAHIGPAESARSYLDIERILHTARAHGAEAIHPGYGFLSENPEFAAACEDAGIVFIGPCAAAIRAMGLKTEARRIAAEAGVAVVPGGGAPVAGIEEALEAAKRAGYPVMLKAAAGGGGKGMRRVYSEAEMAAAFRDASSEAGRSFRNPALYIEKLLERPRHIEVQVLGDRRGHLIHLGERECSVQRRQQKVIEESPSPLVAAYPELREKLGEAAVRVARAAGYINAGTVEFLVDADRNFYFLEMNTRLQVEHPVTELVTGLDLVHWQLRIAAGEPLTLEQPSIAWHGAAIECRVCAEDPERNFLPCPGTIAQFEPPSGPGIRLDSGVYPGCSVPLEYDSLLAKLISWGGTRAEAIARMTGALAEFSISGIQTNLGFFRRILDDPEFRAGRLHTGFIDEMATRTDQEAPEDAELRAVAALAAAFHGAGRMTSAEGDHSNPAGSAWAREGRRRLLG